MLNKLKFFFWKLNHQFGEIFWKNLNTEKIDMKQFGYDGYAVVKKGHKVAQEEADRMMQFIDDIRKEKK